MKIHKYPATISDAAAILDKVTPNWCEKITKDIAPYNNFTCVLGQVFGKYQKGMRELFALDLNGIDGVGDCYIKDDVFGTEANVLEWNKEIKKRQPATIYDLSHGWVITYTSNTDDNESINRGIIAQTGPKTFQLIGFPSCNRENRVVFDELKTTEEKLEKAFDIVILDMSLAYKNLDYFSKVT